MILPNFLIIGASKAATTSIYHHLDAHPEVFMSRVKEVNYFAWSAEGLGFPSEWGKEAHHEFPAKTLEAYAALFESALGCVAIGEASPLYLDSPIAPGNIRKILPDARLIVSLRNPVDRLLSDFKMRNRCGFSDESFEEAFQPGRQLYELGFVSPLLRRYFDRFNREKIKVLLFDDIVADPKAVMKGIYGFLQVSDQFVPDVERRYNTAPDQRRRGRAQGLRGWLGLLKRGLTGRSGAGRRRRGGEHGLSAEAVADARVRLAAIYREDILKLQDLICRDLGAWLKG